jgi:hypothetical protein
MYMRKSKNKIALLAAKFKPRYNPNLDKYESQVLFPEKLALANKMLKGVKIPR